MSYTVEVRGIDQDQDKVEGRITWTGQGYQLDPPNKPFLKWLVEKPLKVGGRFYTHRDGERFLQMMAACHTSAYLRVIPIHEQVQATLSLEHYGSEAPGAGWVSAGAGKWVKAHESSEPPVPLPLADGAGPRIAVIGGGPGGLFTTYILNHRFPSAHITLFEAESLGGKIYSDEFSDGTPFEAGVAELYEYLSPDRKGADPLRSLIENDLRLKTVDMSGGAIILRDKLVRDLDEVESTFGQDTRRRIEAFHRKMAELVPIEKYSQRWQPDNEHPWANKTFRDCIREELGDDPLAVDYIETAVHSDLATESHTCNGLNGIKNVLLDNDKYMQLYHVLGGIERVMDGLAEKIRATVRTECRVTGLEKKGQRYQVHYQVADEEESDRFDYLFVALPNHWLGQLNWGDGILKEAIHRVLAHYDLPAHYLRVSILFEQKWWEKHHIPGDFWMMDMFGGCCVYDESHRWEPAPGPKKHGHVLSFLLAGGAALLQRSHNQTEEEIITAVLESLPVWMKEDALAHVVEGQVDSYVGSVNAQPGGWPVEELRGEHQPEPNEHPGLFLVGDYFFDSTLNAALISAMTAVDILMEMAGDKRQEVKSEALEELMEDSKALSLVR
jgi:hypothetical protein